MIPVLLIVIPLVTGLAGFFLKSGRGVRGWALLSSLVTLAVSLWGLSLSRDSSLLHTSVEWLPDLGSRFAVGLDGLSTILVVVDGHQLPADFCCHLAG